MFCNCLGLRSDGGKKRGERRIDGKEDEVRSLFKTLKLLTRLLPSPPFHRASTKTRNPYAVVYTSNVQFTQKRMKTFSCFPFFFVLFLFLRFLIFFPFPKAHNVEKQAEKKRSRSQRMWSERGPAIARSREREQREKTDLLKRRINDVLKSNNKPPRGQAGAQATQGIISALFSSLAGNTRRKHNQR